MLKDMKWSIISYVDWAQFCQIIDVRVVTELSKGRLHPPWLAKQQEVWTLYLVLGWSVKMSQLILLLFLGMWQKALTISAKTSTLKWSIAGFLSGGSKDTRKPVELRCSARKCFGSIEREQDCLKNSWMKRYLPSGSVQASLNNTTLQPTL